MVAVLLIKSTVMILAMDGLIGWEVWCLFLCNIVFEADSNCPVTSVSTEQPLIWEQKLSGPHL